MNDVMYFEIQAEDPERAKKFYSDIFEWKFTQQEGLPIDYWSIETNGINGGLYKRPASIPSTPSGTNAFVCSMQVADFDTVASKILTNGGEIALEKFAVPGKCWQGYFLDPEGNTFGIFEVDEKAA
ncbi:MAG TPA: VOC family protein [Candidatus Saccharimonadales bacterium]|nr:VOC family protein [Candidatus Saccharimonadales bacterium]